MNLPLEGACVFVLSRRGPLLYVLAVSGTKGLCVPGGALVPGETPEDAATRELLEETGLGVRVAERLRPLDTRPTDNGVTCHGFWIPESGTIGTPIGSAEGEPIWILPSRLILDRNARFPEYCRVMLPTVVDAFIRECGETSIGPPPFVGHTTGKDPWDLLPMEPIQQVVKVLAFGARKYAPHAWMHVPDPIEKYYAAMQRHIVAWRNGEQIDSESGLHHLAHAGCDLVFLLWFELREEKRRTQLTSKQEAVHGNPARNSDARGPD